MSEVNREDIQAEAMEKNIPFWEQFFRRVGMGETLERLERQCQRNSQTKTPTEKTNYVKELLALVTE